MSEQHGHALDAANEDVVHIHGGQPLSGSVKLDGFKHAFVTCLAASVLGGHRIVLGGAPDQEESRVLQRLVRRAGADVERHGTEVVVDTRSATWGTLDPDLFDAIHGSVYLVPGLLAHSGQADLRPAGGCVIGDDSGGQRPTEQYVQVLERFGATVQERSDGALRATCSGLIGTDIDMADFVRHRDIMSGPLYSGATKFAILCAAAARGHSLITNPYPKVDVTEMCRLLVAMGGDIEPVGRDTLRVSRGSLWDGAREVRHEIIPDLMQAVTWLAGGVSTSGGVTVECRSPERMIAALAPEIRALDRMGVEVFPTSAGLRALTAGPLRPTVVDASSRQVYSDAQPFLALLLTGAHGISRVEDRVWRKRFSYVDGLETLGCRLRSGDGFADIAGPHRPSNPGTSVHGQDLRAAATLSLAAAQVDGWTAVSGVGHLDRGYQDFFGVLRKLGARVERSHA